MVLSYFLYILNNYLIKVFSLFFKQDLRMSKKNQSSVFRQASYLIMRHAVTQFKLIWLQLFCRCGDSSVQVCVFSRRSYLLLCSHTEPRHQTLCDQYRWLGILLSIFKKRVTEIFSTLFSFSHTHPVWKCLQSNLKVCKLALMTSLYGNMKLTSCSINLIRSLSPDQNHHTDQMTSLTQCRDVLSHQCV